jgi:hypothetical protein
MRKNIWNEKGTQMKVKHCGDTFQNVAYMRNFVPKYKFPKIYLIIHYNMLDL